MSSVVKFSCNMATPDGSVNSFNSLYPPAAAIVGTAKKKENSAAFLRVNLVVIPPTIVAIDLDTPGIMAIHCQNPILRARFHPIS